MRVLTRCVLPVASEDGHVPVLMAVFGYMLPAMALLNFSTRRWRFGLGVAAWLLATAAIGADRHRSPTARSFFGVYRVRMVDDAHDAIIR